MSKMDIEKAEESLRANQNRLEQSIDRLKQKITVSADKAGHVLDTVRNPGNHIRHAFNDYLSSGREVASNTVASARVSTARWFDSTQRVATKQAAWARQNPLMTIGISAGMVAGGILLGRMVASRKRPSIELAGEFIDKCAARWAFEKTGVQLYDVLLAKCPPHFADRLQSIRNEEREHEEMLEDVIRRYGRDPHFTTESVRVTRLENEGIANVVRNEEFKYGLEAILKAELIDATGWDLLVRLAQKIGDADAEDRFTEAMETEERHVVQIRELMRQSTLHRTPAFY